MDGDHRHLTHRAAIERQAHVLRTIGAYRGFAVGRLAAEERLHGWMVEGEHAGLQRQTEPCPHGISVVFAAVRDAVGSALTRACGHLAGAPMTHAAVASPPAPKRSGCGDPE